MATLPGAAPPPAGQLAAAFVSPVPLGRPRPALAGRAARRRAGLPGGTPRRGSGGGSSGGGGGGGGPSRRRRPPPPVPLPPPAPARNVTPLTAVGGTSPPPSSPPPPPPPGAGAGPWHEQLLTAGLPLSAVVMDFVGDAPGMWRRGASTLTVRCPFHDDTNPSMSVSDTTGRYRCFACGAAGDALRFEAEARGLPTRRAALESLAQRYPEAAALSTGRSADAARARAYVATERRLSAATVAAFGIGYAPDAFDYLTTYLTRDCGYEEDECVAVGLLSRSAKTGRVYDTFRDRVMVPIRDGDGDVVAFGGRALSPSERAPKYINSAESALFRKRSLLFNGHRVAAVLGGWREAEEAAAAAAAGSVVDVDGNIRRMTPADVGTIVPLGEDGTELVALPRPPAGGGNVFIVEGYMDVLSLHQAGVATAVAAMGTALSREQLLAALATASPDAGVVINFDGDAAGVAAVARLCDSLLPSLPPAAADRVRVAFLPPKYKDADAFSMWGEGNPNADIFSRYMAGVPRGPLKAVLAAETRLWGMMRQAGARLVGPPGPPDEDDPTATTAERVAAALGRRRQREEEELLRLALHAAPRHRAPILRLGLAAQVELEVAGCSLWSTDARDALWGVLTRRGRGESLAAVRQALWETEGPAVAAAVDHLFRDPTNAASHLPDPR
ncbi:hypothetical protein I4F81_010323 [Pyropia yezoensis]|uniref:Uncharacterized protein n=1 Tax=Pyropia yezoensis TaxID=2788 RepID=A0ACC3CCE3_PYRYE|nr:hypothetical protein I4F81_010323 [Neopyropia yezoensis]